MGRHLPTCTTVLSLLVAGCAWTPGRAGPAASAPAFELHLVGWTEWTTPRGRRGVPHTVALSLRGKVLADGDVTTLRIDGAALSVGPASMPWAAQASAELAGARIVVGRDADGVAPRVEGVRADALAFLRSDLALVAATAVTGAHDEAATVKVRLAGGTARGVPRVLRRPGGRVPCGGEEEAPCSVTLLEGSGAWRDDATHTEVSARWAGWERLPRRAGLASAGAVRYIVDVVNRGEDGEAPITEKKTVVARWSLTLP